MLDTIKFKIYNSSVEDILNIYDKLEVNKEKLDQKFIPDYLNENIRNINIRIYPNRTIQISGSLSKFYYGNNYMTLDYYSLIDAISSLENELGISLNNAFLSRLDISSVVETCYPPNVYLSSFLTCPFKSRYQTDEGLYFLSKNDNIVIYNKKKGFKKIDDTLYMRYEHRLESKRKIKEKLKTERVVDLKTTEVFNRLVEFWFNSYKSIDKVDRIYNANDINSLKDFTKHIYSIGIESLGGVASTFSFISQLQHQGNIQNKIAYKCKVSVKDNFVSKEKCENQYVIEMNELFSNEYIRLLI